MPFRSQSGSVGGVRKAGSLRHAREDRYDRGADVGGGGREYNAVTTQLMQSIDRYRSLDGLLIMAATNYLDGLEPTLIRDDSFIWMMPATEIARTTAPMPIATITSTSVTPSSARGQGAERIADPLQAPLDADPSDGTAAS